VVAAWWTGSPGVSAPPAGSFARLGADAKMQNLQSARG
jgi:hypothetical protein